MTRAFEEQFEDELRHPQIDFSTLKPDTAGSMEFGVHIRTRPLYLELKATEWDDLPTKLLSKATATLRYLE